MSHCVIKKEENGDNTYHLLTEIALSPYNTVRHDSIYHTVCNKKRTGAPRSRKCLRKETEQKSVGSIEGDRSCDVTLCKSTDAKRYMLLVELK